VIDLLERELVGQVDGGLVGSFTALALPVHAVGGVIPAAVTDGALDGHVDDLVDHLLGLDDRLLALGARVIKSEGAANADDPRSAYVAVLGTKLPLVILLIVDVEA